jgi:NAD(P)-dependent dehydrogenase (short-subunit alcohol dehydrogenase family)
MSAVLIIGASRGIGLEAVRLALKAGHSVRALARSASAIRLRDPRLEKLDGDALDREMIERALEGVHAVIQTLGVSPTPELIFQRNTAVFRCHSHPR